ncbi:MAG: hypothetical protein ACOYOT_00915 [Bacteroidales bacterium]
MKKICLLFLIVYTANALCQQSFAPKSTEWYYGLTIFSNSSDSVNNNYDYIHLSSEKDTVINGKSCNKIILDRGNMLCIPLKTAYLYQSNDTVYYYSDIDEFSPLYVFNAGKGDLWNIRYKDGNVSVTVDSISSQNALGRSLKVQHITYRTLINNNPTYQIQYSSSIVEGIGDLEYLFRFIIHEIPNCDNRTAFHSGLRCYINPIKGTYSTSNLACDFVSGIHNTTKGFIRQYVTPIHSLKVESLDGNISSIKLMNINGQTIVVNNRIYNQSFEIPIPISISGIFISVITMENGQKSVSKIIL